MTKYLSLLLFIGLVWGQNPCDDPKYIALKEKGVDNMNDEEFDYFINILPNCKSDKEKVIEKKKKLHEIKRYNEWKEKWPSIEESFTLPDGTFDMESYNRWLAKQHGIKLNQKPKSVVQREPNDPCSDKRYNEIKHKSFDQMSEREYNYFILMEKQCSEQNTKSIQSHNQSSYRKKYQSENQTNSLWYDAGKELLNIIDDHQNDTYDIFNPNSYNSTPLCQYDDSRLKSTFETKIEGGNLRKFRKYQCSNIVETHYFWIRE